MMFKTISSKHRIWFKGIILAFNNDNSILFELKFFDKVAVAEKFKSWIIILKSLSITSPEMISWILNPLVVKLTLFISKEPSPVSIKISIKISVCSSRQSPQNNLDEIKYIYYQFLVLVYFMCF